MFRASGKVVLFLLFLLLVRRETAVAQFSQNAPDMRVLDSSEQGITVEFVPHYLPLKKDTVKDKVYDVVQFERGLPFDYAFAGKPDVRYRSVLIGLPGRNGNRISIVQSDFETMTGISLKTIPSFQRTKEEQKNDLGQANNGSENFPADIVSLTNVGIVDGIFVGTITLCPLQYQQTAHTLKKYSRIVFHVDYGTPEGVRSHAGTVDWEKQALINGTVMEKLSASRPPLAKTAQVNSVLAAGKWVKLEIQSDGMYKIDASYLRTIGMDAAVGGPFSSVKVYGNNGRVLPPNLNVSRPADLTQFPVLVVDNNNNGNFDADDYILFYAPGVTGWNYSPSQKTYSHYLNPYTNSNYCFIQYLPGETQAKIQSVSINGSVGGDVTTTVGKVFFHEEKTNVTHSGLEWYSSPFDALVATTRVISNKLDGYTTGTPVTYKYELLSRADVSSSFTLTESDKFLTTVPIPAMTNDVLNDPAAVYEYSKAGQVTTVPNLVDQRSNLKLVYRADSKAAIGWIYWIEILYTQQLVPVSDELLFTSPDTSGTVEYNLSGFSSSNVSVFDVTNVFNVRSLAVTQAQEAGRILFKDTLSSGSIKKYWAGTSAAYKTPASFTAIPNSNLHGITSGADFVIITHHDFLTQAQQLRDYKQNLPGGDALRTMVVEVDTLYNEFGDGMPDPTAIRDFLKYATTQWQVPPKYVLFFGDATYDYKNILRETKDWVPTYETSTTRDQIYTYAYDDYFCSLDPLNSTTVSMAHGRLAVRTPEEAQLVVDKIMQYEAKPSHGAWQNIITIVADDGYVNDANYDETFHTTQAENLATIDTPKIFDVKKIYEVDYPTVIAATGHRKPAARQAILDQVNRGTLVLNFTGHGNPTVWAHESILTQSDVNSQFFNADKLTFVCAATCDWGRFDDGNTQSSAEDIITNPNGGAISVFSADRAVYSGDNALINYKFYDYTFPQNPYQRTLRLGDAVMLAKNNAGSDPDNNRKYHLLGDPTLRLAVPRLVMSIDSINGIPLSQSQSDTLKAFEKVTIKGAVRDNNGSVQTGINGTALVTVFDAQRNRHIVDYGFAYNFVQAGGIIYKGEDTVRNGQLSATFIIPKDISYENKSGKLSVYFSTPTSDGRGYTENVVIGGTSSDTIVDTQGPSIRIYLDDNSFRSGDLVNENPVLYVDLSDSGGINTSTSGIGHGLTAWLDDSSKGIDLSDYYTGKKDSYQEGTVQYQLPGLAPGRHTLQVKAWNVYNYSSSDHVEFTVAPSTTLSLQNVYNIPNPVTVARTTFTFQQNQLTPIDVHIKIYTIAGRLVQTIDRYAVADRFVEIPWDCRDRDGDLLGNGIYLYKVMASTIDGNMTSEALGKLAIVR